MLNVSNIINNCIDITLKIVMIGFFYRYGVSTQQRTLQEAIPHIWKVTSLKSE
jgi:hypothetical protein